MKVLNYLQNITETCGGDMNITPDWIEDLKLNEVFTFGSNEAGRHGAGAAKQALRFGARYGQGFGLAGQTFAIPTMDKNIIKLPLEKVEDYVERFIQFASYHPEKIFLVTAVGCGLAGFSVEEIAPLFWGCQDTKNICLPKAFLQTTQSFNQSYPQYNIPDLL